eukprot:5403435-Prymnesium_polylepis.2
MIPTGDLSISPSFLVCGLNSSCPSLLNTTIIVLLVVLLVQIHQSRECRGNLEGDRRRRRLDVGRSLVSNVAGDKAVRVHRRHGSRARAPLLFRRARLRHLLLVRLDPLAVDADAVEVLDELIGLGLTRHVNDADHAAVSDARCNEVDDLHLAVLRGKLAQPLCVRHVIRDRMRGQVGHVDVHVLQRPRLDWRRSCLRDGLVDIATDTTHHHRLCAGVQDRRQRLLLVQKDAVVTVAARARGPSHANGVGEAHAPVVVRVLPAAAALMRHGRRTRLDARQGQVIKVDR